MQWDKSHYWIDYTCKRKGIHESFVVHPADVADMMNDLVERAYEEIGERIPENASWAGGDWFTVRKHLTTVKVEAFPAYTETEMVQMGLLDDPSEIKLDLKVWGEIISVEK